MSDISLFSIIDLPAVILALLYRSFETSKYSDEAVGCDGFLTNHQPHPTIEIFFH